MAYLSKNNSGNRYTDAKTGDIFEVTYQSYDENGIRLEKLSTKLVYLSDDYVSDKTDILNADKYLTRADALIIIYNFLSRE